MIDTIQTSSDSEPFAAPAAAEAKNANERPGAETVPTGSTQIKTEPENASAQSESHKPNGAESNEPREPGRGEPGPGHKESIKPDGPEKIKRDAVMMLQTSPLASGEDFADYRALMDEICKAVDRKDFFDELRVADLGHALWEEKRYRKQLVALPKATRFKALLALLFQVSPNYNWNASELALDYFGPDAERRDRTKGFLLRYGITDEAITAQAQEMHGQAIGALERMIGARQTLRNRVIKEVQRDKRKAEKKRTKSKHEDGAGGSTH